MLRKILLVLAITGFLFIQGCGQVKVSATPPFPDPEPAAIDKIQALHDPAVDNWMVRLFKLKKQLEVARAEEAKDSAADNADSGSSN